MRQDTKFPKEMSQEEFAILANRLVEEKYMPKKITRGVFMVRNGNEWAYYQQPRWKGPWVRIQHGGT